MKRLSDQTISKGPLYEKLMAYGASDYYGFHMPGHKRNMEDGELPYQIDITEIDGFDDLHHPKKRGILTEAQKRAARLYKADETHFLVNGSTAGVLSAISGCTHSKGRLLLGRNSHRSAYHAAGLNRLQLRYIYPQLLEELGINGGIFTEDVDKSLAEDQEIQAVFVTSPTYEGICLNLRAIAQTCHKYGVPLIVDQAHGAHLPFSPYFPEDALTAGADVVIQSVHKTLPALTQTALLHIQGDLVDRERLRYYLSVYQSSSPSYVLMASIDNCMERLEQKGEALFAAYTEQLKSFRDSCGNLKCLKLIGKEIIGRSGIYDFDNSRLVISARRNGLSGYELSKRLQMQYHIQMEMAADRYVVGISTIADSKEGFHRLKHALWELDDSLDIDGCGAPIDLPKLPKAAAALPLGTALEQEKEWLAADKCRNRICAAYLYLYPPGIPLVVPGEVLTEQICCAVKESIAAGQGLHGMDSNGRIAVLKESMLHSYRMGKDEQE